MSFFWWFAGQGAGDIGQVTGRVVVWCERMGCDGYGDGDGM